MSGARARRWLARCGGALLVATVVAPARSTAHAQAVGVTLRLRPRAGDTLHLRFEQTVSGTGPATGESTGASGGRAAERLLSSMVVLSRSVVEQSDASGCVVVAHTDSVTMRMPGAPPEALSRARRGMQGRVTRMRVAPDGAMQWMPPGAAAGAVPEKAASGTALGLPGALPAMAVAVGSTWTRTMPLPWAEGAADGGADGAPRLEVVFRLDSLARNGTLAFVSMHGRLRATAGNAARVGGATVAGGTADGALRLDLARGWIVDSRADFVLDVLPNPAPGTPSARPSSPMRLRIAQRLVAR